MVELKVEVESVVGHEICCDASGPRDPLTVRVIFNKAECSFFFPFPFFSLPFFFSFFVSCAWVWSGSEKETSIMIGEFPAIGYDQYDLMVPVWPRWMGLAPTGSAGCAM